MFGARRSGYGRIAAWRLVVFPGVAQTGFNISESTALLTPEQQLDFIEVDPETFIRVKGAWGDRGATYVHLESAGREIVTRALSAAWKNTARKKLIARHFPQHERRP